MLFNKKEKIIELVSKHSNQVLKCYTRYMEILDEIVNYDGNNIEVLNEYSTEMRVLESEADAIRHEIIKKLLEGGLLVDSRKSITRIIEGVDRVADITEDLVQEIYFQNLKDVKQFSKSIKEMNDITLRQLQLLQYVVEKIVTTYSVEEMHEHIKNIESLETKVDDIEHKTIRNLFATDLDLAVKLQYKDFIARIGSISDMVEDVSDMIEIVMLARKV